MRSERTIPSILYLFLCLALLVAAPAVTQDAPDMRGELLELLESGDVTNGQLAMSLLRAVEGDRFQPPACMAGEEMFIDVPANSIFCPWIEELARRGITGGCSTTEYCPGAPVTRAQMATFVVHAMEACPTLDPTDEMVRVGGVCIDKYEASIWDAPVGGNLIPNNQSIPCDLNGQNCDNIYARSVAGVEPRIAATWFQAQAALANSGKRLPTNAEWQMAVIGTPDPGSTPGSEDCNTDSPSMDATGERENCVSRWGAHDMVGNVWEWVADWVPDSINDCPGWGSFSDDWMCLTGASTTTQGPGAFYRGGNRVFGTPAGPFAIRVKEPFSSVGFRGAR